MRKGGTHVFFKGVTHICRAVRQHRVQILLLLDNASLSRCTKEHIWDTEKVNILDRILTNYEKFIDKQMDVQNQNIYYTEQICDLNGTASTAGLITTDHWPPSRSKKTADPDSETDKGNFFNFFFKVPVVLDQFSLAEAPLSISPLCHTCQSLSNGTSWDHSCLCMFKLAINCSKACSDQFSLMHVCVCGSRLGAQNYMSTNGGLYVVKFTAQKSFVHLKLQSNEQ